MVAVMTMATTVPMGSNSYERVTIWIKNSLQGVAFIASLIILMIVARRLFGEWAEAMFVGVIALLGLIFWVFKPQKQRDCVLMILRMLQRLLGLLW
jgi:hypothetical protein